MSREQLIRRAFDLYVAFACGFIFGGAFVSSSGPTWVLLVLMIPIPFWADWNSRLRKKQPGDRP